MKNYGILKYSNVGVDDFTSETGIKIRRELNPVLRVVFKAATKGNVIIENYPKLEKDCQYIFVSTHNFVEDSIANLSVIDRNAYLLFGTTDQLKVNKEMYAAWANGFIYVDRQNNVSRKEALLKMKRVLDSGTSVLIFAEGGFNNSENLLCLKLFASPYILSKQTGIKVVPIAPFYEPGTNDIYINAGEPLDLTRFDDKKEALTLLRDNLATLLYENIFKYASRIKRQELGDDPRLDYMESRRKEYLKTNWTKDVWDEELTQYLDDYDKEILAINNDLSKLNLNINNSYLVKDVLKRVKEKKYDFKKYMHENWNKD